MKNPNTPEELRAVIEEGGQRRARKWILLLLPLLLIALVGGGYWWKSRNDAAKDVPPYETRALEKGSIHLTITVTGNLEPTNKVTVGSELSGIAKEVYVDTNDHVTVGQPLAQLDTTRIEQQLLSSRATVRSAKARVGQAQATLREVEAVLARQEEMKRLSDGRIPSRADMESSIAAVERAKADLLSAEAAVIEAEAQVRIQENDQGKAIIRSPIDGIVLTRSLEVGQTVAASFTAPELFLIAEKLEHMKLKVAIPEADIGRVSPGQKAEFMVDAWPDRTYQATVQKVSYGSVITDNVVTYETELEVINEDLSLRPGMTATADIRVAEAEDVFLVPNAALRFDPQQAVAQQSAGGSRTSFVQSLTPRFGRRGGQQRRAGADTPQSNRFSQLWVLENGEPVALRVRVGIDDGRFTEVRGEGLKAGLPVIVRAYFPVP